MLKRKSKHQTYQDGYGTIWKVVDRKLTSIRQPVVHYQEQTVGERRFWDACVAGTEVSRAVKVPYETSVDRGDVIVIGDAQYEVVQKDMKTDVPPVSWLLSLAHIPIAYRSGNNG